MRRLLLASLFLVTVAGCSAPATAAAPAAAPAVAVDAPPQAQVRFTADPRAVAGTRTYDLTGVAADGRCTPEAVSIRDDAAAQGELDGLYLTLGSTPVVEPSLNTTGAGWSYDTSYVTSDGKAGSATATATVRDGRLEIVFDGRTWDGSTFSGTASCAVAP